jgi:hypothetical protein
LCQRTFRRNKQEPCPSQPEVDFELHLIMRHTTVPDVALISDTSSQDFGSSSRRETAPSMASSKPASDVPTISSHLVDIVGHGCLPLRRGQRTSTRRVPGPEAPNGLSPPSRRGQTVHHPLQTLQRQPPTAGSFPERNAMEYSGLLGRPLTKGGQQYRLCIFRTDKNQ